MGKLIFTHGVMDSGKSSMLIQKAYQFDKKGRNVTVLRPNTDTRSKHGKVESDIGISWPCTEVGNEDSLYCCIPAIYKNHVIIVDEAQFLQTRHVEELADIADTHNLLILAFGLKTDFSGNLFPATKRLIELADRVDEIPSMCECGKKATHHYRISNNTDVVSIGDEKDYVSCCRKCWKEKMSNKDTPENTPKDKPTPDYLQRIMDIVKTRGHARTTDELGQDLGYVWYYQGKVNVYGVEFKVLQSTGLYLDESESLDLYDDIGTVESLSVGDKVDKQLLGIFENTFEPAAPKQL